jgi:ABC-type ATPase involved in cell division
MNDNIQPVYFGAHQVWDTPISITDEDRRRHLYIIGRPGAGKSRLMENLFLQDIYAGRGAAFIDPHGTGTAQIRAILHAKRQPYRQSDCV